MSGDLKYFDKIVTPNDIEPGNLPNAYFLIALSSISEFPDGIKRNFLF